MKTARHFVQRLLARGLHRLDARLGAGRDGTLQRLLDRTSFEPEVRPFSVEAIHGMLDDWQFRRVAVLITDRSGDAAASVLARSAGETLIPATLDRMLKSFNGGPLPQLDAERLAAVDAVVVVDPDPEEYVNVLRLGCDTGVRRPVLTDFSRLPWVGGEAPLFAGELASTVYLHHHFGEVFGIKDPVQLQFEVRDGSSVRARGFRLLAANETIRFRLPDLGVTSLEHGVFRHVAHHPRFLGLPHRRFRAVVDVHGASSECTHHGIELERELTNYAAAGGAVDPEVVRLGPRSRVLLSAIRSNSAAPVAVPLRLSLLERPGTAIEVSPTDVTRTVSIAETFGIAAAQEASVPVHLLMQGPCDRVCWTSLQERPAGVVVSGNHGTQVDRGKVLAGDTEKADGGDLEEAAALRREDVLLHPYAIPVYPDALGVRTGFHFASSVPPIEHFDVAVFDAAGRLCRRGEVQLAFGGPAGEPDGQDPFIDARSLAPEGLARTGGLIVLAPAYERERLAPGDVREAAYMRVEDCRSGDFDYTEVQSGWRNIPGYFTRHPSNPFSGRARAMKNRTSVMIRAVHGPDSVTDLLLMLVSGDLRFERRAAPVEIRYFRPDGRSLIGHLAIDAFTSTYVRLLELFPEITRFSPDGYGWIRVTSGSVDLNTFAVNRGATGSIAVQHLWGQ